MSRRQYKLPKLLGEGFKISIYWNKYKVIGNIEANIARNNEEEHIRKRPDASYQGVKRLFVLGYDKTADHTHHNNQVFIILSKKSFCHELK